MPKGPKWTEGEGIFTGHSVSHDFVDGASVKSIITTLEARRGTDGLENRMYLGDKLGSNLSENVNPQILSDPAGSLFESFEEGLEISEPSPSM